MSEQRDPMELARRGPKGNIDRFLALWLNLLVDGKQAGLGTSVAQVRRAVDHFFGDKQLQAARAAAGDDALADELRNAAEVYFQTCLTDPQYSTTLFRTKRLEADQLEAKAAKDAATIIGALAEAKALDGFAARLPGLVAQGFTGAFGAEAEAALRVAVGRNAAASRIAPLIWD